MVTNSPANIPTAASGKVLQGQGIGTANAFSTATYPSTGGTASTIMRSDGTNWVNTTNFKVSSSDVMTNTSQPCFLAYNANTATDVTGDGTVYTCQFDTESFDNANNFATNTFTAPVTGRYMFSAGMYIADIGAGHTLANFQLVTSGGALLFFLYCNPVNIANGTNLLMSGSAIVPMTVGATCNMRMVVSGSTKTIDWVGAGLNANPPYFSGFLIG